MCYTCNFGKEVNLECVVGVGNFDLDFLSHLFPKSRCSCAHLKENFMNFPKLTLLLSAVHLQGVLWAFEHKPLKNFSAKVPIRKRTSELTLLLFLVSILKELWQFETSRHFFGGNPVQENDT